MKTQSKVAARFVALVVAPLVLIGFVVAIPLTTLGRVPLVGDYVTAFFALTGKWLWRTAALGVLYGWYLGANGDRIAIGFAVVATLWFWHQCATDVVRIRVQQGTWFQRR